MKDKIRTINELSKIIENIKSEGKKIVHCHGVFDLLHIGHIKHFEVAKTYGDILIVSITPDEFVNKGPGRPVFKTSLRMEALAALEIIDYVVVNNLPSAEQIIKSLKPDFYIKGPDYKDSIADITGKINTEAESVESIGGKVVYTEDITFSSSSLLNKYGGIQSDDQKAFVRDIARENSFESITKKIDSLEKLKVLVVGETIIDEYIYCEALGKSGKEPVLVLRDLEKQKYLGGVLAIARHLTDFCSKVSVLSYLGENNEYKAFIEDTIEEGIELNFLQKKDSPTTLKRRFLDNIDRKKLLGVYSINDDLLSESDENKFIESFDRLSKEHDLIIVSDYGHGIITPRIAKHISNSESFICLNAQVNAANIGTHNIRKYSDINCLIINETELRHEMRQRQGDSVEMASRLSEIINSKITTVTMGKSGVFLLENQKSLSCPGFAKQVVDKIGSGDALFALLSICIFGNLENKLSLFIGSIAAAQSVETIGNSMPVSKISLLKTINHLLK